MSTKKSRTSDRKRRRAQRRMERAERKPVPQQPLGFPRGKCIQGNSLLKKNIICFCGKHLNENRDKLWLIQ